MAPNGIWSCECIINILCIYHYKPRQRKGFHGWLAGFWGPENGVSFNTKSLEHNFLQQWCAFSIRCGVCVVDLFEYFNS